MVQIKKYIIGKRFIFLLALSFTLFILIFTFVPANITIAQNSRCSLNGGEKTTIDFTNESNQPVSLYSLDKQCNEKLVETIDAGMKVSPNGFIQQTWRIRDTHKGWLIRELTLGNNNPTKVVNFDGNITRSEKNRPDDISGYQLQAMYVLPKNGQDLSLDTNGKIATAVATFQQWLATQTSDQRLRFDTYQGALDITFVRLKETDEQIKSQGKKVRDIIDDELKSLGFNNPQKLYAVYYGGSSTVSCGAFAWPPGKIGHVAAVFQNGTAKVGRPCDTKNFATDINKPGYLELEWIHHIIHSLGGAQKCAPHYVEKRLPGHVSDSPKDLLYEGNQPWEPSILDQGHDDYYRHNIPGCYDLAKSVFLDPTDKNPLPPPGW
jgi:hypothetical protein